MRYYNHNEIGMLTTKLTELLSDMNERLELLLSQQTNNTTDVDGDSDSAIIRAHGKLEVP